jgi:hypothetical protein
MLGSDPGTTGRGGEVASFHVMDASAAAGVTMFSTPLAVRVETPEADLGEVCRLRCVQGRCEGGLCAIVTFGGMTSDCLAQTVPASVAETPEGYAGQLGF